MLSFVHSKICSNSADVWRFWGITTTSVLFIYVPQWLLIFR